MSTDCSQIAREAEKQGAEVVVRPDHLASDDATSESAVLHCLATLHEREAYAPELVMLVQCTTPFTTPKDLDGLIKTLVGRGADSAFTAVPFHHFLWEDSEDGPLRPVNHSGRQRLRRQDLPLHMLEDGGAYLMRSELFRQTHERFCGKTVVHVVERDWALEIDSESDFRRAEAILPLIRPTGHVADLSGVTTIVLDFDGVLTDNAVYVSEDGGESVRCDRGDGFGLEQLKSMGIRALIMSKERNAVVTARAKKLGIECIQGQDEKLPVLLRWLADTTTDTSSVIFVGNDVNDVDCMANVGLSACPADAHARVRAIATIVLTRHGGHGAVRELCDLIASARVE